MNLKHQIVTNDVKIEREILPTLSVVPVKIDQVFQNIISNAIKFKKLNETLVIKIVCTPNKDYWQLSIIDNGIGIDKKNQEKIFSPFQKIYTDAEYAGSGIGLATCKKIVELHKGKIWVESTLNKGTSFHFTLSTEESLSHMENDNKTALQRQEG